MVRGVVVGRSRALDAIANDYNAVAASTASEVEIRARAATAAATAAFVCFSYLAGCFVASIATATSTTKPLCAVIHTTTAAAATNSGGISN